MFREFEFMEVLALWNSYGEKTYDCCEGRGFTVAFKEMQKDMFEISVTACVPENLKVEIVRRDNCDKLEEVTPRKYLITRNEFSHHQFEVFVKSTKVFKQVDPILPCAREKAKCITFEDLIWKNVKLGEITECQFRPYEGVVIDAEIRCKESAHIFDIKLTSKTHVLQFARAANHLGEYIRLSFLPGETSSSAASNAEESSLTLTRRVDSYYQKTGTAIPLNIYEKKKSFQEKIDAHGPTNVNIKTSDGKVVKVHREILIAKSAVFAALLNSETEIPHEIEVNYDAESVFRAMTFVYDNEKLEIAGFEPECYKFAEEFGMPELKQKCVESMEEMNWQHVDWKYIGFAYSHKIESLKQKCDSRFGNYRDKDSKEFASCAPSVAPAPVL